MRAEIILLIEEILNLKRGSINENTKIKDVAEWDSLGHIMIIGALQEKLNINISLDDAMKMESVMDIFDKIGI